MPNNFINIPDWFSWENQGAGIAVADLNGNGQQDLIVLMVDAPPGQNEANYRIGQNLDDDGAISSGWSEWKPVPDWFSFENQGASVAVADLDANGQAELIVFMIDSADGKNQGFYRVGKQLDATGNINGGWGPWIPVPDWFSFENQHGAIAVADLDQDGRPELIVFMIDNPGGQNQGLYCIGKKLDVDGNVTGGWSPWMPVPDWFSWENQGAGVAVADMGGDIQDLIIFQIDNAIGQNQAFYKIAKQIDANGNPAGGWGAWMGAPGWFSWENQGGGIAVAPLGGQPKLLVFMVDNPPDQNAGFYEVVDLVEEPAIHGQWEMLPFHSGVLAVHAALLHTGKVLFFAGSGSSGVRFRSPDFGDVNKGVSISVVWDPEVAPGSGNPNFFHPATLDVADGKPFDLFCCGHTFLPDGRLLAAGGTLDYGPPPLLFRGSAEAAVFDPVGQDWSFVTHMAHGRWYPTLVTLADGRVLATTGLDEGFANNHNQAVEIYSTVTDTWEVRHFTAGFPGLPLYAHLFLMRDGRIFFSGGRMDDDLGVQPCIFDITQNPVPTQPVNDLLDPVLRNQSASVILPPAQDQKIMIMGGGPTGKQNQTDATGMVSIVDLTTETPEYVAAAPMLLPRIHLNAILLPDHTVFVSGGSLKQENAPLARLQAELYDPTTDTWRLLATATVPRLYHSVALLLPDGRVVAAGSNPNGGQSVAWEPADPEEELRLEVFSPPYLFKGQRPSIGAVTTEWGYGQTITISSPQTGAIRWVSLIRNGITTHSFDCGQRLVDLDIVSQTSGKIKVQVTNEPGIAPPGWYMLFLTDTNGIPSVAKWIHLV
ncbi:galactose oxidase-like domain-containing protein [Methyloglobulus sp.]|uniref:galactose oxidase-like domain-containing protein n=1 Tax=Methyloglobulus sp. TaxID=2518622 RepID=UPI00398A491B